MKDLTPQEEMNLATFSDPRVVGDVYNKEGFTRVEEYLINKYFTGKGRVLDVGCGTGRTTKPLKDKGFDVVGIDLSGEMINFAKSKYKDVEFRVMNACQLDFGDEEFDHVLFSFNGIDCIYPYSKRVECFKEIRRVMKRGGIFLFSSHNAWAIPTNRELIKFFFKNLWNFRISGNYRMEDHPGGKLCLYYCAPYFEKKLLQDLGFEALEFTGKRFLKGISAEFLELALYYAAKKS